MNIKQPALLIAALGFLISGASQADFNRGMPGQGFIPPPPPPPGFGGDQHDGDGWRGGGWQGGHDWHGGDDGHGGGGWQGGHDWHGGDDGHSGGGWQGGGDWHGQPRVNRICFYDQPNYGGNTFCMNPGQSLASLVPSGWNDRIASISVEGDIQAVVYNDVNFRNGQYTVTESLPSLQGLFYWGISSIVVSPNPSDPVPGGNNPQPGFDNRDPKICFFDQPYYRGASFCMKPGDQIPNLVPNGWNDRIQSFYIQGTVEAVLWNDVGPHGANVNVTESNPVLNLGWGVSAIQVLRGPTNPFGH